MTFFRSRFFWWTAVGLIALLVVMTRFSSLNLDSSTPSSLSSAPSLANQTDQDKSEPTVSSSSDPDRKLTIPYLRQQTWDSKLAPLELYSSNFSYHSYLTSYHSEELKINGLLTKPTGEMPPGGWPAVVFVHGYIPPQEYQTTERYVDYVNYLAQRGLVVFKIDLRGHGDSQGIPGGAYFSGDYVIDVLNAYAALQSADFVNAEKIGLWGHSMAGNVVFRAMVAKPDIPAVVIWAGAVYTYQDLQDLGISDNSYRPPATDSPRRQRRQSLFDTHGQFDMNNDFWRQVVPTNYLNEVTGALQIHHAINDSVVSVKYSRNLNKLLDGTRIKHELYEYSLGGHNLESPAFPQAMQRTVEFYQDQLLGQ